MMATTAGYVLVGGMSSRFGADKALAVWQGRPLALSVAERVKAAAGSVTLVGSIEKYAALGLRVIADPVAGHGPLAGLAAALDDTAAEWNLVVACDMPYLSVQFLSFLLSSASAAQADILLPLDREGQPEPLCAVYAQQCGPAIWDAVRSGAHKMTDPFRALRVQTMPFAQYAAYDGAGRLFTNLNTPRDLEAALPAG